jgi:histidine triad (HIT) family protein
MKMEISREHKFSGKVKRTKPEVSSHCLFCKIIEGKIPTEKIWEDEKYLAFLDNQPLRKGHTLVLPKKHTDYIFDMNDKEYSELMLKAKEIAKQLKSKFKTKRVIMLVEGFEIPHAHIHLIPSDKAMEIKK